MHMAELSNDPLGAARRRRHLRRSTTQARCTSPRRRRRPASPGSSTRRRAASTARPTEDLVDEESPLAPADRVRRAASSSSNGTSGAMADDDFSPTFLRNATAYGASPRMRFDIVLNNLCGLAWTTREIRMESDGTPWRPLVHVLDIAKAVACVLEAPRERVHGQVLNVGDPEGELPDPRDRRDRRPRLPGLRGHRRPTRAGCSQLPGLVREDPRGAARVSLASGTPSSARSSSSTSSRASTSTRVTFARASYTRLKQIEHLVATGQIDDAFLWRPVGRAACRQLAPAQHGQHDAHPPLHLTIVACLGRDQLGGVPMVRAKLLVTMPGRL